MKTKINIDRIRLCLQQPENFYDNLYHNLDDASDRRVYYEGFFLSVRDEQVNDKDITASLFLEDETPIELGTFTFNKSRKYGTKCFFSYNTKCLYDTAGYVSEGNGKEFVKYNYFNYPFLAFWHMGLVFNNVTSVEIACDTEASVISKIQYAVSHPDLLYMILLGKNVDDPNAILEGYWEYYQRSRLRKASRPSLYIHPVYSASSSGNKCELKVYDKARELAQTRPDKEVLIRSWNGMSGKIQRLEVTVENKKFRQFFKKINQKYPNRWLISNPTTSTPQEQRKQLYREALEHFFFDLGMDDILRYEMFVYFANNLLHFKLHNRQKTQLSILDLCVNSIASLKDCVSPPKRCRQK